MYQISYLPAAEEDLDEIITYLTDKLAAPQAALWLLDAIDAAIETLRHHPYAHEAYRAMGPLAFEIRKVPIRNFRMFYAVCENTVEIHRILYGKRDLGALLSEDWQ